MVDLAERIEQLSDLNAVGALRLVLEKRNSNSADISVTAEDEERRFRLALDDPKARQELEARALIEPGHTARDNRSRAGDWPALRSSTWLSRVASLMMT